jgi:hypothetical protein
VLEMPANLTDGYVVGQYLLAVADTTRDADRLAKVAYAEIMAAHPEVKRLESRGRLRGDDPLAAHDADDDLDDEDDAPF